MKHNKKQIIPATLVIGILSVWLLLAAWFNIPPADAQDVLDEDEAVALTVWGTTEDPNIAAILMTQVITGTNLTLGEVHLGYDKTSGTLLNDPTISRSTFPVTSQIAAALKSGSDIDPSRIRFGSGFDFAVKPGLAPEVSEQLSKAALSGASGSVELPYMVIQFNFPVDLAAKSQLEQNGVIFGGPIDKLSFYAKIPPSALAAVTRAIDAGQVHFVGTTPPETRVAEPLKAKINERRQETLLVIVQLFESPTPAQLEALRAFINITQVADGPLHLVSGTIETARILTLAQQPLVQWVEEETLAELGNVKDPTLAEPLSMPPANFEGNLSTGADFVKLLGLNGNGINVAVMDSGIAHQGTTYHPDLLANRIVDQYYWDPHSNFESPDAPDDHGHGTHIAGTIGGSGIYDSDYSWQGLAPAVNFLSYRLSNNNAGFNPTDFQSALQRGVNHAMHIANNSWGGIYHGQYFIDSELVDWAVRGGFGSRPVNIVISAGNENTLTGIPGTAKNGVTVGTVKDGNWPQSTFNWEPCSDTNWPPAERICFSNFGPLDADNDGATRVKPDLMAAGVRVASTWPWYLTPSGNNSYYETHDGTSFAAPQVSAAMAQFLDAYSTLIPWPEVVKAALIVSATDVGGANVAQYGRGMLNIVHAIYDQANISDTTYWTGALTSSGATANHTFTVPAGFDEVRVVLTWADPLSAAGNDNVINDLDVKVYDGKGVLVGKSSTADDTVEYIKVTNGTPGTWRIEANAFSLSSTQAYGLAALVILNKANLTVSGSSSIAGGNSSSRDFYVYSILSNNGFAAPGSYVQLQLPNTILYGVKGARIYTADGRSHFYNATDLHHDVGFRNWDVAVGETISGIPRIVRWHIHYAGTDCPAASINLQAYYRDAGTTVLGASASVPFSCRQSATYLPLIIK